MIPFLQSIAKAYTSRYSDLSDFCFLFPNKRSGTFFLKYLRGECDNHLMLSPEIKSISDFVSEITGKVVASRIELLFLLYESYMEHIGLDINSNSDSEGLSFDSFYSWGDTLLSDFSEVDQYMVEADEIFKNVKDFREISSNFLTDEQKRVIKEYFGHQDYSNPDEFWKNFDDEDELSESKKKFLHLWRIMAPLYYSLKDKLNSKGLATTGGIYREAAEILKEKGNKVLGYKKIVVIGFNALSTSELTIFNALKKMTIKDSNDTLADFFWDATGPVLSEIDGTGSQNTASKFVAANIKAFPCPDWALPWLRLSDVEEMPEALRVISSPSNSAQTKIAGNILAQMHENVEKETFHDAKVAVVLADESLLLPMLYSLPNTMGDVNLTMGYSFRMTSVVSFVNVLRRLLRDRVTSRNEISFYHEDLRLFLSHPLSHLYFSTQVTNEIIGYLDEHHRVRMTTEEMKGYSDLLSDLLNGYKPDFTPSQCIDYLIQILKGITNSIKNDKRENREKGNNLEISHINLYIDRLLILGDVIKEFDMKMKPGTVFRLADRLVGGEKVAFDGEPLKGLQVMGMLETRSLDFDHLILLSANERILPMRIRKRSFIPNTLRNAFGMPPANYAESIFAYYFYRMISRAKSVSLIYDGRSGSGLSGGDVSRYILQLRHLFAKGRIKEEDWKFDLKGKEKKDASIIKNSEIKSLISEYYTENGRKLSVSSLKAYRDCEVKFFYKTVMRIDIDPAPTAFLDSIGAGNVFHRAMLELYHPHPSNHNSILDTPRTISRPELENIIQDRIALQALIRRIINKLHFKYKDEDLDRPLSEGIGIVAAHIERQILMVLRHDLEYAPFTIYGCEVEDTLRVKLKSGKFVNFTFAIDRLDEKNTDGVSRLRIVDYKTGKVAIEINDFDEIFTGGFTGDQIFQLFSYAWLLEKINTQIKADQIGVEIYGATTILNSDNRTKPLIEDVEVNDYREFACQFSERMDMMLEEIIEKPVFEATKDEDECKKCAFRVLCGR